MKYILSFCLLLTGCYMPPPPPPSNQVQLRLGKVHTITHDGHQFIVAEYGAGGVSIIHHPSCGCSK